MWLKVVGKTSVIHIFHNPGPQFAYNWLCVTYNIFPLCALVSLLVK